MVRLHVVAAVLLVAGSGIVAAQEAKPEAPEVSKQHHFLKQFVGEWECEGKAFVEPDKPPVKIDSQMTGKMIGDFWAIAIIKGAAFGHPYHGQGTFGYDTRKKKYIGTWTDSMSDFMWHYEGTVEGNKLVLNSEGPNPNDPGKMIKARDTWEFKGNDTLIVTGQMEGPDGKMMTMMTATGKRKK